jgi:membrane protein
MPATRLQVVAQRLETTFAGRCGREFITLQGFDRSLVLASHCQAFTALIPLLLLVSALAPANDRDIVARALIGRFRLTGDAADAVRQLFTHSGSSATGVLSGFLWSSPASRSRGGCSGCTSRAWQVRPRPGIVHAAYAALGLAALVLGIALLYAARALVDQLPVSGVLLLIVSVAASFVLWTAARTAMARTIPSSVLTNARNRLPARYAPGQG